MQKTFALYFLLNFCIWRVKYIWNLIEGGMAHHTSKLKPNDFKCIKKRWKNAGRKKAWLQKNGKCNAEKLSLWLHLRSDEQKGVKCLPSLEYCSSHVSVSKYDLFLKNLFKCSKCLRLFNVHSSLILPALYTMDWTANNSVEPKFTSAFKIYWFGYYTVST